jgi:malonyl-CoA/methylmalonyl-CoA synthetase
VLMGVPTMYARILDEARDGDDLGSLRIAVSGSAPLGEALWRRFHARFGIALVERYGLTETTIVTSNPIDAPKPGSVGLPLPDMTIAIHAQGEYLSVDAARAATPVDDVLAASGIAPAGNHGGYDRTAVTETKPPSAVQHVPRRKITGSRTPRGEICIAGPTVMRGYGNDPEANTRSFRDGFFHSGDLGFIDAEGYVWVDGRLKDLIIVGGSNVVPGEVERALSVVQEAAELCVAGASDTDLGEIVAAYIVSRPGADRAHVESELRKAAEATLAPYKRPRRYVFLSELPRNPMGKVDRTKLPNPNNGAIN